MPDQEEIKIKLKPFQHRFLISEARFVAMVSAIATGKTRWGLYKLWQFCQKYPNSLTLLLRKQQTDAFGSTHKDFKSYFGSEFNSSNEFNFPNGSTILTKHAGETSALTNYNLNFILVEQAEELDKEIFTFLRDRIRRQTSPYQQIVLLANAAGENYIKELFINGAEKINTLDEYTGQREYFKGDFHCLTANTWANKENLPPAYVKDLEKMKEDSPNHYKVFVENSLEVIDSDDLVYTWDELKEAREKKFPMHPFFNRRLAGFDYARMGNDKCGCVIIEQRGQRFWEVVHVDDWGKKHLNETEGKVRDIIRNEKVDDSVHDADGLGAHSYDNISEGGQKSDIHEFRNLLLSKDKDPDHANHRTAAAFALKLLLQKGYICIRDERLINEMLTVKFRYQNNGQKILVSKNELRKEGVPSPNLFDSLLMAVSIIDTASQAQVRDVYGPVPNRRRQPEYSPDEDLFKIAGIR